MKKEAAKKAPEKKATTKVVDVTPTKKEKPTANARVSNSPMMEVVVTAKKFGTYKKGDVIKMHRTTGNACIKSGVVKEK